MRRRNAAVLLVAVAALGGCDGEVTHDVAWYKAHEEERKSKIAQCENDPGELRYAPNCVNAKKAEGALSFGAGSARIPSL